jgi:hypothetical protein
VRGLVASARTRWPDGDAKNPGARDAGNLRTDREIVQPHDTEHVAGDGRVTRNELDLDAIDDPVIRYLVVEFAALVDAQPYPDLEDRFMSAMAQFITDAISGPDRYVSRGGDGSRNALGAEVVLSQLDTSNLETLGELIHAVAEDFRSVTATCAVCGRGPLWGRSDTRYCTNACRQRAYRQRKAVAS